MELQTARKEVHGLEKRKDFKLIVCPEPRDVLSLSSKIEIVQGGGSIVYGVRWRTFIAFSLRTSIVMNLNPKTLRKPHRGSVTVIVKSIAEEDEKLRRLPDSLSVIIASQTPLHRLRRRGGGYGGGEAEKFVKPPMHALNTAERAATGNRVDVKRLFYRISLVGATGGKVSDVLNSFVSKAYALDTRVLFNFVREFRKAKRYELCYEILEWMKENKYNYGPGQYAVHLDVVSTLKGVAEAEKYFDSLPAEVKDRYTYGALLNSYCRESMAEKAATLFKEMDKLNFVSHLAFNTLIAMSLKLGEPEKVSFLMQEMENRNLPVEPFTWILSMQAHAMMNDIEGIERAFEKIKKGNGIDWTAYSNLADAYLKIGRLDKAELALEQLEDLVTSKTHTRSAYKFLISFYATTGNSDGVYRAWDLLKAHYPICHNMSYLCLLQALSKLDKVDDLEKYFEEWSTGCQYYDPVVPRMVIRTYLSHNLIDKAEQVFESASSKAKSPLFEDYEFFMDYYLKKGDIRSALRHMEKAIAEVNQDQKWQPTPEIISSFFMRFEEERDGVGAEGFCRMLKKAECLDSKPYLSLLQVYVAAGKSNVEMRKRMEEDGIEISSEHEKLLEKVCPNANL
ncbi:hypothetical protein Dimus_016736 [Dionaea muscipula]